MIFLIARILTRLFSIDIQKAQRAAAFVLIGCILLILLIAGLWIRSCVGKRQTKIDLQAIEKINSQNRKEREAELQKVIEENAEVVRTVDNRSTIADTNVIERNVKIAEAVKEADKKIQEAKSQGRDVTGAELNCILTGENCP